MPTGVNKNPYFFGTDVLQQRVPWVVHGGSEIRSRRLAHIAFTLSVVVFSRFHSLEENGSDS